MLVDTDVLIWMLRGQASARRAIEAVRPVTLSAVTYMELAQGVRGQNELRLLRQTLEVGGWRILPLTENVGHRAIMYIEDYGLSDGLRLADALIAATAVESGNGLLTGNARHYRCIPNMLLSQYAP